MTADLGSTPSPGYPAPERKPSNLGLYPTARDAFETWLPLTIREVREIWRVERARRDAATRETSPSETCPPDAYEAEVLGRSWGWRACGRCGATIMLGEEAHRLRLGESSEQVCLGCAGVP